LIGNVVNVYARQLHIVDIDSFTRGQIYQGFQLIRKGCYDLCIYFFNKDWYLQPPICIKQPPSSGFTASLQQPKLESGIQIPPHTGFGSEHDSLGSVFSIHPKQEYRRTALIKTGVEVSCLNQLHPTRY
jgi:hypothetical protein